MTQDDRFCIFLDFDGVLVNKFSELSTSHPGPAFDPLCVETLEQLIAALAGDGWEVAIIVTSRWRYEMDHGLIRRLLLHHYGFASFPIIEIGFLPMLGSKKVEIKEYIADHRLPAKRYLILDDDDLGQELGLRQIRTRYEDGLRGIRAEQIVDLIQGYAP